MCLDYPASNAHHTIDVATQVPPQVIQIPDVCRTEPQKSRVPIYMDQIFGQANPGQSLVAPLHMKHPSKSELGK